ncbi:aspartyl protease [Scytonema sp. NUACC26]|uniref:aspartyl protease n=1 Tax=Scytonema sp. NUACC26 TaxID=3140176 RepID=UPI0034DB9A54
MTLSGRFGDEDALFFEIALIDSQGLELQIEALFDTGFSYWLAVDKQDIDGFGWIYVDRQRMQTARGNSRFDIYAGKIKLDGTAYDIPVHVGKGLSEVLLGRQWLTTRRLLVDMPQQLLTLG